MCVRAHAHGPGAAERRLEHRVGRNRRLTERIPVPRGLGVAARLQHDDGLDARRLAQRRHEQSRIVHGFDVEQDPVGLAIVHERLEDLAEADVDAPTQ